MTNLKFDLDIDSEIQKLGLPIANPANPANREENRAKISRISRISNLPFVDLDNPATKKNPNIDLLTEVELEAFNGWYASCRKPEFGMTHEEATLKSWELLIESMVVLYREEKERYASGNKRNTENGEN